MYVIPIRVGVSKSLKVREVKNQEKYRNDLFLLLPDYKRGYKSILHSHGQKNKEVSK